LTLSDPRYQTLGRNKAPHGVFLLSGDGFRQQHRAE